MGFVEIFSRRAQWNCERDPSLPKIGRQAPGLVFFWRHNYGHAPWGEGRQTPGTRGSISTLTPSRAGILQGILTKKRGLSRLLLFPYYDRNQDKCEQAGNNSDSR